MKKVAFYLILLFIVMALSACAAQPSAPTPTASPTTAPTTTPTTNPTGVPTVTSTPAPTGTPEPQWVLVWSDEFEQPDGSPPNPKTWIHTTGGAGFGNGELQYYSDDIKNAYIENNMLVIKAIAEEYMGRYYTSARLNTLTLAQFTYGRMEVRAKLPNTQGIWPAIWMLPARGAPPVSGEIDIMELIGSEPYRAYGTLHYGAPHESQSGYYDLPGGATYDQDFHVFAIEWEAEEIRWYVDGQMYLKANQWFTSQSNSPYPAPFNKPFYFILNVAVGGYWPGKPDETSVFPQTMIVDYVRVYQIK